MVCSRGCLLFKVLLGGVAMLAFVWFLSVATSLQPESGVTKTTKTKITLTVQSGGILNKHHEVDIGREKLVYDPQLDFNYMMGKRKVPNGPDPIHNRKAGNSKRPPGRV